MNRVAVAILILSSWRAAPLAADTIWVDASYANCPGTGTEADPFCSLQDALDHAQNGDDIRVLPGDYHAPINFLGKAVRVESTGGASVTDIIGNAFNSAVLFVSGEGPASELIGFRIRRGAPGVDCQDSSPTLRQNLIRGNGLSESTGGIRCSGTAAPWIEDNEIVENHSFWGGGISCLDSSSPMIRDNVIESNRGGPGAGIAVRGSSTASVIGNRIRFNGNANGDCSGIMVTDGASPLIEDNLVQANLASVSGGGVCAVDYSTPVIRGNRILDHRLTSGPSVGGGVKITSSATVTLEKNVIANNVCTFSGGGVFIYSQSGFSFHVVSDNIIADNEAGMAGGGLYSESCSALIENNQILRNRVLAGDGGGIEVIEGLPTIRNNWISENSADGDGGGARLAFFRTRIQGQFIGNLIVRNDCTGLGGGLSICGLAVTANNTIADNVAGAGGGGAYWCATGSASILSTILWNNTPDQIAGSDFSSLTVEHCDVQGGFSGSGNIDVDPLFRDPLGQDYSLRCDSPCVDSGHPAPVDALPRFDLDGRDLRKIGELDIGADEVGLEIELNGVPLAGGPPVGFLLRHPDAAGAMRSGIVFISAGSGSGTGIRVPNGNGRRLALDFDATISAWTQLPLETRQVPLVGCGGAATVSVMIPSTVPVGLEVFFAGVAFDPEVASLSTTRSFRIE